jgi:hypothetical protein
MASDSVNITIERIGMTTERITAPARPADTAE